MYLYFLKIIKQKEAAQELKTDSAADTSLPCVFHSVPGTGRELKGNCYKPHFSFLPLGKTCLRGSGEQVWRGGEGKVEEQQVRTLR